MEAVDIEDDGELPCDAGGDLDEANGLSWGRLTLTCPFSAGFAFRRPSMNDWYHPAPAGLARELRVQGHLDLAAEGLAPVDGLKRAA